MSDYELDSFDVAAHFRKKQYPAGVYIVLAVLGLGLIGSCSNEMDKEREAKARQQRVSCINCTPTRASLYR